MGRDRDGRSGGGADTDLGLSSTGISAHDISRLTSLTGLQYLNIQEASTPDELPPDITAAIDALRPQLLHTRINGLWSRPDLHALIQAGGEEIPDIDETGSKPAEPITWALHARRRTPDRVTAYLTLRLADGYHLSPPDTEDAPAPGIEIRTENGWEISEVIYPSPADNRLTGTVLVVVDLTGTGGDLTLHGRIRLRRNNSCLAPADLLAHCAVG